MQLTKDTYLELVRLGIGHPTNITNTQIDWQKIYSLGTNHGLLAVVIDGIDWLPKEKRPRQELLLGWIGEALQSYEYRYDAYRHIIADMARFYNSHGYKMMVLKGYACSLNWPKPTHRPCGDIDIWLFGKQKEADEIISKEKNIKIDNSHHHHTVFEWDGFTVDNHYDFVNVHGHHSSAELEKMFKELGKDDSHFVEMRDESTSFVTKVYLPSPNLHALFLIKHMVSHFAAAEISLRQVLDWAFFVEKHREEVDWNWLLCMLKKYHMNEFFNLINAICVEDLGFKTEIFPTVQFLPELKERVLNDILEPAFTSAEPKEFIPRMIYKFSRWQGNAWKQKLCYPESRWITFWRGVWTKILKPASL